MTDVIDPVDALRDLIRSYESLVRTARDRIIDLGGDCDPAPRMIADDPALREARAALTAAEAAGMVWVKREVLEPLKPLALDLGRVSGAIDNQVYREMVRHDWDPPDDCEFDVVLTTKHIVTIDRLHASLIKALMAAARPSLTGPEQERG